jgi:hypothetical protein
VDTLNPADPPGDPASTYTGQDGREHRYLAVGMPKVVRPHSGTVEVQAVPLGPAEEHDFNALMREVTAATHQIAKDYGDVVVARQITIKVVETVITLR